jgi:hypothetical protein
LGAHYVSIQKYRQQHAEDLSRRRHLRKHIDRGVCMSICRGMSMDSRELGRPNIYVCMYVCMYVGGWVV